MHIPTKITKPFALLAIATVLTSCVKDDIYNTSHPNHGKISLRMDWSQRGEDIPAPGKQCVNVGPYTAELSGEEFQFPNLIEPGDYRVYIYNPVVGITVSGTTATVATTGNRIDTSPGWWFSCALDTRIVKDTDYALTAVMKQQVRQLTLLLKPEGSLAGKIESINATLTGLAGVWDMSTDQPASNPAEAAITFHEITTGDNAGLWTATLRLLGTNGTAQKLTGTIRYEGGTPLDTPLQSDLSEKLAAFNTDKRTPLSLGAEVIPVPASAGFTATVTDWVVVTDEIQVN